ncbi:MAG: hypothetical protein HDT42_00130 [Ruminococcaceae bacterium]|nr:hypothetical protein [Oscillospiraceae bacterium]
MAAEIKSEIVDINGKSVLLVSVRNGDGIIGTCCAGHIENSASALTRLFYIGNDPIISLIAPNFGNKQSDKLISFCPGFQGYEPKINEAIGIGYKKLNEGESLSSALKDIFGVLQDGVYVAYLSDYYPTDGSGNFFWGAYNISHEIQGTAEHSRVIGNRAYKPCFLIPSQPLDYFQARTKMTTDDSAKSRRVLGIAYHLSGLHSVLLKGHHSAASCTERGIPFTCAVIEKITEPYTDVISVKAPPQPVKTAPTEETEEDSENPENTEKQTKAPAPSPQLEELVPVSDGVTGFRSASVKLPLADIPKEMLKMLIEGRAEYKPRNFNTLIAKLGTMRRKSVSNNVLPFPVLDAADKMPDSEMISSAYAIDSLSDAQLNCLLAGDVECNGEIIVSPNYYSSIVTACNYLQFTDTKRFVDFAIAVMDNSELSAAHEYVARRVMGQDSNKKLLSFFKSVISSGDTKYDKILNDAQTFVDRVNNKEK